MKKLFLILAICFLHAAGINPFFKNIAQAYNGTTSWIINFEHSKTFIENKGQFNGRNNLPGSEIFYAVDQSATQIYFTKNGLTYRFDRHEKNRHRQKGDTLKAKYVKQSDWVHLVWEGANPAAKLIAEDIAPDYHTYS